MIEKSKKINAPEYDYKRLREAARRNGYGWADGVWCTGLRRDLIAAGIRVGIVTVSHWVNGRAIPDAVEIGALSGVLGVPVSEFYTGCRDAD